MFNIFATRPHKLAVLVPVCKTINSVHAYHHRLKKMVRFFPNTFEDYKPGADVSISQEKLSQSILEHIKFITKRIQPNRQSADGGLYVGALGVAYMYYHLSKNPILSYYKATFIEKALEYTQPGLEQSIGDKTSFVLGDAGTYALAAVLISDETLRSVALNKFQNLYNSYLPMNFLDCGSDEFFVGRAGYIAGALWLRRELHHPILDNEQYYQICDVMVESGRHYAAKHTSRCPLMYHYYSTEYLGAAHGISFILQMLLSVPGYLEHNPAAAIDIENSISFIASLQLEDGNWPCCMEEIGLNDHKLVHWCHGAPGVIYLMAKAYLVFKDQKYLDCCIKAGELIWQKGLLYKGPGICHGVAGNGYAFLLLFRLTKDQKYLHRAKMFAEFMEMDKFVRDSKVPDNPQSLYEGTAGTVLFLSDLTCPDNAEFPFQDVFSKYIIQ